MRGCALWPDGDVEGDFGVEKRGCDGGEVGVDEAEGGEVVLWEGGGDGGEELVGEGGERLSGHCSGC